MNLAQYKSSRAFCDRKKSYDAGEIGLFTLNNTATYRVSAWTTVLGNYFLGCLS